MAKLTIDLSNYKDRTGSRVPEGRYRVQVEDVEQTTASTGSTMINLFLRIMGGEQDGATLVDRLVLSDKALFRTVNFMQALGIPTPKKRLSIDINKWVGKVLDVDVADGEPYNGRVRSEVQGFLKPAKVAKAEEEDDLDIEEEDVEEVESQDVEEVEAEDVEEVEEEKPAKKAKAKAEPAEDVESADDGALDLDSIDL